MYRVMAINFRAHCSGFLRIVPVLFFPSIMLTASFSAPSQQNNAPLSAKQIKKKIDAVGKQIDSVAYLREQRIKDSIQTVAKKESDRTQMRMEIRRIEDKIRLCDTAISLAVKKKAGDAEANKQKIVAMGKSIQVMSRQKKENDDHKLRIEKEADAAVAKRKRLIESSQTVQNRYERLRTPYEEAVKAAEAELSQIKEEQQLHLALRKKLEINRTVSQARDSLDKAIQMQAKRKRGAKKIVDRWEFVLDSLNSSQDALKRKYPTLSHRENMLPGLTLAQKILAADTEIARVEKKIPGAKAPYERARNKLLAFEKKNPPPQGPSPDRLARLDSSIAGQKRELFRMADISDSLGMQIEEARNSIKTLSSPSQYDQEDDDAQLSAKRKERSTLAEKRIRLVEDSVRRVSENESALQRITGEIALLNSQLATLQDERARLQTAAEGSEREAAKSRQKPEKDYYSERVTEPETEPVLEDDVQFYQAKQKLKALIKTREKAERDIANAEKTAREKRKEIKRQDKLIKKKQKALDRLAKARKKKGETDVALSPAVVNARATEIAQKRLEEIYILLSDNEISKAVQRFRQLRPFLKAKLDPEAFQTLVATLEQMGAVLQ
jgi:hypothetical protein